MDEHYTLARVLVKTRTVEIWDSLASEDDPIQNKRVIKEIVSSYSLIFMNWVQDTRYTNSYCILVIVAFKFGSLTRRRDFEVERC